MQSGAFAVFSVVWWNGVIPLICVFSAFTNSVSIIVLFRLRSHQTIYKHMLWKCSAHLVNALIGAFVFLAHCGSYCGSRVQNSFAVQFYSVYLYSFTSGVIILVSTMCETWIALERLLLIRNVDSDGLCCCCFCFCYCCYRRGNRSVMLAAFVIVALITCLPSLFLVQIKSVPISFIVPLNTLDNSMISNIVVANNNNSSLNSLLSFTNTSEQINSDNETTAIDYFNYYYQALAVTDTASRFALATEAGLRVCIFDALLILITWLICVSIRRLAQAKLHMKHLTATTTIATHANTIPTASHTINSSDNKNNATRQKTAAIPTVNCKL